MGVLSTARRMRALWASTFVAVLFVGSAACIDELPAFTSTDAAAGVEGGGADAADSGQATGDSAADGSIDGACASGLVSPIRVFDATEEPRSTIGPACNIDAVLARDGVSAGLDRAGTVNGAAVDGVSVQSCVGVELAGGLTIDKARIVASPSANACGTPCDSVMSLCGTGHEIVVFASSSEARSGWKSAGTHSIGDAGLAEYVVNLTGLGLPSVRFIIVCRAKWGADRDDVAVDFVGASCL